MLRDEISGLRQNYTQGTLDENEVDKNAINQFEKWFADAKAAAIYEPNAMTLATSQNNIPDARIVLLKSLSQEGFVFFTNYNSAKGKELTANPTAALVFLWKELERQVRIRGTVKKVSKEVSEAYFQSRPIESQCGAIASQQSQEIASRQALTEQYENMLKKYENEKPVMPANWGGYILEPTEIEFWQGREGRMHDRLSYKKTGAAWKIIRLQP